MSKAPKIDPQTQAHILSEALPHMQRYDEEIVVVKYGGHAMGQEQTARDFAKDIVLLEQEHVRSDRYDGKTIEQLRADLAAKTGENIRIARFARFAVGEE